MSASPQTLEKQLGTTTPAAATSAETQPGSVQVKEYSEDCRVAWDNYVMQHPQGTLFHLTRWKRAMERAFGYQQRYLYAESNGQIAGVLPLMCVKNPVIGKVLVSTPFAVYGGVRASHEAARLALQEHACQMAKEENAEHLELRDKEELTYSEEFHRKELYVNFERELPGDPEQLMKSFPRDTRYMVRKGQKAGLRSVIDDAQLPILHNIYAESVRNLGTPVFSLRYFKILTEEFSDMIENLVIWHGDKPVAACMSFRFRDWIVPYYGGASIAARQVAANNFMYWEVMRLAIERGTKNYDFGRSKLNTGAHFFKTQWAMTEKPLPYQFYLVKRKEMPNFSPTNSRFQFAIAMWKKIPLPLAKLVGPPIVKLFP